METESLYWIVAGFGVACLGLVGLLAKGGKPGFGPNNLRAVGMVLVGTFATLVSVWTQDDSAAMAILGAIAGYLFGLRGKNGEDVKQVVSSRQ